MFLFLPYCIRVMAKKVLKEPLPCCMQQAVQGFTQEAEGYYFLMAL